jgi:hypothetical protein
MKTEQICMCNKIL